MLTENNMIYQSINLFEWFSDKKIAVKIVSRIKRKCFHISLSREMNAVSLKHPNIVEIFQVIEHPNSDLGFVFMELNTSKNLEDLLDTLIPFNVKLK